MLSFYKFNKDVGCPHLPYTKALVYVLVGGPSGFRSQYLAVMSGLLSRLS